MKSLSDEAIQGEYESWLDLQDDENQIKGLREVAQAQHKDTLRQVAEWGIEPCNEHYRGGGAISKRECPECWKGLAGETVCPHCEGQKWIWENHGSEGYQQETCSVCKGMGIYSPSGRGSDGFEECSECDGTGNIAVEITPWKDNIETCPDCKGTGKERFSKHIGTRLSCPTCKGTGIKDSSGVVCVECAKEIPPEVEVHYICIHGEDGNVDTDLVPMCGECYHSKVWIGKDKL